MKQMNFLRYKKTLSGYNWRSHPSLKRSQLGMLSFPPAEFKDCGEIPQPLYSFFQSAHKKRSSNDFHQAIALYTKLLALDNDHFASRINIGVCFLKTKSTSEALNHFEQAIETNKHRYEGYFNKAIAFLNFGQYEEAIRVLNQGKELIQTIPESYNRLRTFCLYKCGKASVGLEKQDSIDKIVNPKDSSYIVFRSPDSKWTKSVQEFDNRSIKTSTNRQVPSFHSIKPFIKARRKNIYRKNEKKEEIQADGEAVYIGRKHLRKRSYSEKNFRSESPWIQQDLSDLSVKKSVLNVQQSHDQLQLKIKRITGKLNKEKITRVSSIEDIKSQALTQKEVKLILKEFENPSKNLDKIDKALEKLLFFKKFGANIRKNIYKVASVSIYHPRDIIFEQGDTGSNMYVILKGSVAIQRQAEEFGGKPIVIASLYDGNQFGELALIKGSSERLATCMVSEQSVILELSKEDFNQILMSNMQQDLDSKLEFFASLPLFADIDPTFLIPLASNIELKRFQLDEVILEKGQMPQGLYIIYSGVASVLTEGFALQPSAHKDKLRPFYTGNSIPHTHRLRKDKPQIVKERVPFAMLNPKDFFGGRALLEGDVIEEVSNNYSIRLKTVSILPSKFSVTAQSTEVLLYVVTKELANFLNEKCLNTLKSVLKNSYEVDCPNEINPKAMDNMFNYWQKFRKNLADEIRDRSLIEKTKAFPFLRH